MAANEVTLPVEKSTENSKRCALINHIQAGDCMQLPQSYVHLFRIDELLEPGLAVCTWNCITTTMHTQWKDQWHQKFTFLTDDGQIAAGAQFDGPEMKEVNKIYSQRESKIININSNIFSSITQVRWNCEC